MVVAVSAQVYTYSTYIHRNHPWSCRREYSVHLHRWANPSDVTVRRMTEQCRYKSLLVQPTHQCQCRPPFAGYIAYGVDNRVALGLLCFCTRQVDTKRRHSTPLGTCLFFFNSPSFCMSLHSRMCDYWHARSMMGLPSEADHKVHSTRIMSTPRRVRHRIPQMRLKTRINLHPVEQGATLPVWLLALTRGARPDISRKGIHSMDHWRLKRVVPRLPERVPRFQPPPPHCTTCKLAMSTPGEHWGSGLPKLHRDNLMAACK